LDNSAGTGQSGNAIWFLNSGLYSAIASTRESTGDWGTDIRFYTHPTTTTNQFDVTERMRITSNGNVVIGGGTAPLPLSNAGLTIYAVNGSTNATLSIKANNASGSNAAIYLEAPGVVGGGMYQDRNSSTLRVWQAFETTGVQLTNGATSWSSFSDERLKTDLVSIDNAIDKIINIRAVTGRYKTDSVGTSRSFLIAQDVQRVFPEAVEALTDEMGTLTLRYTEIIPVIVKAVQEEDAEVKALRQEVELLKSQIAQLGSN
jgi:hypothetical protein